MRYLCTECSTDLDEDLICKSCNMAYNRIHDILSFTSPSTYFIDSKITREKFQKLLTIVDDHGWINTLHDYIAENESDAVLQNAANRTRLNVLFTLPLGRRNRALDLGCGWGLHSIGLAYLFDEVYSVDSTLERLKLLKLRADNQNLTNVKPIHADINRMPFPPNSFDFILSNGVLEWMGVNRINLDPQTLQESFLRNLYRLLEPGGTLAIGIENRFAYGFLSGGIDNHSHMRFTSVVPRALATLMSLRKRGEPYQTYTYSLTGYRKILQKIGFNVAVLTPFPNYNFPHFICDTNDKSIYEVFSRFARNPRYTQMRSIIRALSGLTLLKYLMPCYYLVAQKPHNKIPQEVPTVTFSQSWMGNVIQHLELGKPTSFVFSSVKNSSPHITGIVSYHNGDKVVVKSSTNTIFNHLLDNAVSFFQLTKKSEDVLGCPSMTAFGSVFGLHYYAQDYLHGYHMTLTEQNYLDLCEYLVQVSRLSIDFKRQDRHYLKNLEDACMKLLPSHLFLALKNINFFKHINRLDSEIDSVVQHGDFFPGNVLCTKAGFGVIDWDRSRVNGFPIVDLASLSLYHFSEDMQGRRLSTAKEIFFERSNKLYVEQVSSTADKHKIPSSDIVWLEMMHIVEEIVYNLQLVEMNKRLGFYATVDDKIPEYFAILWYFIKLVDKSVL